MSEVSPARLWAMRAMYLFMAAGIGLMIWPLIVSHSSGTIGLLSLLGLRYPLQMLPLLLVELVWKAIWLLAFALPRWLDGTLDEAMRTSVIETSLGALLLLVIPWRYLRAHYVMKPGDPWAFRRPASEGAAARA